MRRLLTGPATSFNLRHRRGGHLFQNRYNSIVCEEKLCLLELVRHIHLTSLRAGLVPDMVALGRYRWCGHSVLLGEGSLRGQVTEQIMGRFVNRLPKARCRQAAACRMAPTRGPTLRPGGNIGQNDRTL